MIHEAILPLGGGARRAIEPGQDRDRATGYPLKFNAIINIRFSIEINTTEITKKWQEDTEHEKMTNHQKWLVVFGDEFFKLEPDQ